MGQLVPDRFGIGGVGEIDHHHSRFDVSAGVLHLGHRFDDVFVAKGGVGRASQRRVRIYIQQQRIPGLGHLAYGLPLDAVNMNADSNAERTDDRAAPSPIAFSVRCPPTWRRLR